MFTFRRHLVFTMDKNGCSRSAPFGVHDGRQYAGQVYLKKIVDWQAQGYFSEEAIWVGSMVIEDAEHVLSLVERIKQLQTEIGVCNSESEMAPWIESIPGFGVISSGVLAGEIGNIERFEKEASLSMYMGMSALDNSSGLYKGSRTPRQVNQRIKRAMMTAVDRHRSQVDESQKYYEKKRAEGKKHNQAIRSLGRHLARVIFKMLKGLLPLIIKHVQQS